MIHRHWYAARTELIPNFLIDVEHGNLPTLGGEMSCKGHAYP